MEIIYAILLLPLIYFFSMAMAGAIMNNYSAWLLSAVLISFIIVVSAIY